MDGPISPVRTSGAGRACLEVQGRWARAIEARLAAVTAFEAAGSSRGGGDRTARRRGPSPVGGETSRAALGLLDDRPRPRRATAGRVDLEARAIGLEGNVLARMGKAR